MRLKALALALLFCLCLPLFSCGRTPLYEKQYYDLFDTVTIIRGYAKSASDFEESCDMIYSELFTCHRLFDIYNEYEGINNIASINKNAGVAPLRVDERIIELLTFGADMHEKTDGALNIAMGAVLSLWHEYRMRNENTLPSDRELSQAAGHCSIDLMTIDKENSTVYLEDSEMSLDTGALAKGYASDRVMELLPSTKLISAVINLGGNVMTYGEKPDGAGVWSVGINSPFGEGTLFKLDCTDMTVVTSGDYQRYYEVEGVRYHHIIDPDTLYPGTRFSQVSVICESGALGDALSTALFLTDLEKGMDIAEDFGAAVIWVTPEGEVYKNKKAEGVPGIN